MIDAGATTGVALDLVLLGSRLAVGSLELALLCAVAVLWLPFGTWLWRASGPVGGAAPSLIFGVVTIGLSVGILAQDALLFYAGIAVAGYGTLVLLLSLHGPGHARTAAAQAMLLVLGDLILFELLAYLYTEAQTTGFDGLRAAFREKGGGLSFVGGLLVAAGGCRVAGLFLLVPLPGGPPPWRVGAVTGLLGIGMTAGLLIGIRLVDPTLATTAVWQVLAAMLGAAVALYLLAVTCVLAQARIDVAFRCLSAVATRTAAFGTGRLVQLARLAARLAPLFLALEQRLLSWPLAVATATAFAALLALSIVFAGAGGSA